MSDPTAADIRRAIQRTGCVRIDGGAFPFCGRHDEDGNPHWDECRWAGVARLVADVRAETLEPVRRFVDGFAERGGGKTTATDELWIMSIRRILDAA